MAEEKEEKTEELEGKPGVIIPFHKHKRDGSPPISHKDLEDISEIHLTADEKEDLTDGGASSAHKHDHGEGDGLGGDDHTQYALRAIMTANGDILYRNGGVWVRLPKGNNGEFLKLASGIPSWAVISPGGTKLVNDTLLGSNAQNVDISSLNLDVDKFYLIYLVLNNQSGGATTYSFYINGDYTATNYRVQLISAGAGSVTSARNNDAVILSSITGSKIVASILVSRGGAGGIRGKFEGSTNDGSNIAWRAGAWNCEVAANLTSIRIAGADADSIGTNSRVIILKISP